MPDSKLVEKLGFEIRGSKIFVKGLPVAGVTNAFESALWNLCLELGERLAGLRIETLKETAKLACDYCRIDGEPTDKSHGQGEGVRWEHDFDDGPVECEAEAIWNLITAADPERKDA